TGGEGGAAAHRLERVAHRMGVADGGYHVLRLDAEGLRGLHGQREARPAQVAAARAELYRSVGVYADLRAGGKPRAEPETHRHAAALSAPERCLVVGMVLHGFEQFD